MADLTICPTFDQKKDKQDLEKINWRIGANNFENRSHECECVHRLLTNA